MELSYRRAAPEDAEVLAPLNRALIEDEGASNPMSPDQLAERMRGWLEGAYSAVLFETGGQPIAYLLYKSDEDGTYIRQFYVDRVHRRQGLGRGCIGIFLHEICTPGVRVYLDVLLHNSTGRRFWEAIGFSECSVRFEQQTSV